VIQRPIAMKQIKRKINQGGCNFFDSLLWLPSTTSLTGPGAFADKTIEDFRADWRLMFTNARTFNDENSAVYMDANTLQAVVDVKLDALTRDGVNGNVGGDDWAERDDSPAMGGGRKRNVVESDEEDAMAAPNGTGGKLKLKLGKPKTPGGGRKGRIDDDESE
jgi:hypothetical protein